MATLQFSTSHFSTRSPYQPFHGFQGFPRRPSSLPLFSPLSSLSSPFHGFQGFPPSSSLSLASSLSSPFHGFQGFSPSPTSLSLSSPFFSSSFRVSRNRTLLLAMASSSPSPSPEMASIGPLTIFTVDGSPVKFEDLWDQENGIAVVAFLRHFGCPLCWDFAASLRDLKPKLDSAGVKLIAIGVGTPDKAQILAERMPFPKECLFADPDRKAYDALGLYYGVGRTFFNPASAQVMGRLDTIQKALKGYTIDATPRDPSSVLQQGGLYIFKGKEILYSRKDEATGDHAPLDKILEVCCQPVPV